MTGTGSPKGNLILAVLLSLPGVARADVEEGGVVRLPAPRIEKLTIRHPQGGLILRGWDRPEIHISFHKRAPTGAMLDLLRVQVEVRDGQARIWSGVEVRGELRGLPQPDSSIDLAIDAPRHAQLVASTFGGDLQTSGFRSGVEVGSNTGALRVSDVSGPVRTHTGKGDQWLRSIQGEVNATGVSGDVDLVSVEGPTLSAEVVQGQITVRDVRTPVIRMHAALGALILLGSLMPGGRYDLQVDEGNIRVDLAPRRDLHFVIEARGAAINNQLRLDPGAVQSTGYLLGELGGGGPYLHLTSPRGQVELRQAP